MGFVDAIHAAVQVYNLSLPDVLFILNTADVPVCTEEQAMRGEGCNCWPTCVALCCRVA